MSHRKINSKRHLNRSRLHLNDAGLSLFVWNFRDFLNNFDKTWLQNKHNLTAYSSLSYKANIYYKPMANSDFLEIQQQRVDNAKSIIEGHLNINSIKNKFIFAVSIVKAFDFFFISESKLDSTFPMNQFHIFGFKVFRRVHVRFGGGLIYINENIPCRYLNDHYSFHNLELIAIEINRNKRRWFFYRYI